MEPIRSSRVFFMTNHLFIRFTYRSITCGVRFFLSNRWKKIAKCANEKKKTVKFSKRFECANRWWLQKSQVLATYTSIHSFSSDFGMKHGNKMLIHIEFYLNELNMVQTFSAYPLWFFPLDMLQNTAFNLFFSDTCFQCRALSLLRNVTDFAARQ